MKRFWMECIFTIVGLLLAGTVVTFLRYVSLWSVLMVSLVFLGMLLTFALGIFVGSDHSFPWRKQRSEVASSSAMMFRLTGNGKRKLQRQPDILTSHR